MKLAQKQTWVLVLAVCFTITMAVPSTREAHLLCFNLLIHREGKTYVQGQPSGCVIYIIPNVQFSESYKLKLIGELEHSPDNFFLAYYPRKPWNSSAPPAKDWFSHPLLEWAVLNCVGDSSVTNKEDLKFARELLDLAKQKDENNGGLWLAEAALNFKEGKDDPAWTALEISASVKTNWVADTPEEFGYCASLFEQAGLSKLDAAVEANWRSSHLGLVYVQGQIMREIGDCMVSAVQTTNDARFCEILSHVLDLGRIEWVTRNQTTQNTFANFRPDDDLINAMRKRLGEPQLSEDFATRQEQRASILLKFVDRLPDQKVAGRLLGRWDASKSLKELRGQRSQLLLRKNMLLEAFVSMAGGLSVITLILLASLVLQLLPFEWLRRSGGIYGIWPNRLRFWIFSVCALIAAGYVCTIGFFRLGLFNEVGFPSVERSELNPLAKALILSVILSVFWFAALILGWKTAKKSFNPSPAIILLAFVYLGSIAVMAYFRLQAAQAISLGF